MEENSSIGQKLAATEEILSIAHHQMHLPDNGSYREYVELGRPYVIWNVFAAPELSLEAKSWCYLVVGCLNYRGYFRESRATEYAKDLQDSGWDVYVGGVRAYSTLGWFKDPLTDTMLEQEVWEVARIIFHELAHQRVFVKDDTEFNEAFADAVAIIGLGKWLHTRPARVQTEVQSSLEQENRFIELALAARDRLAGLYDSQIPDTEKRRGKQRIIERFRQDYRQMKAEYGNDNRYDRWVETGINNAGLSALSTYRRLVSDFLCVYKRVKDIKHFYALIEAAAGCDPDHRLHCLKAAAGPANGISCPGKILNPPAAGGIPGN